MYEITILGGVVFFDLKDINNVPITSYSVCYLDNTCIYHNGVRIDYNIKFTIDDIKNKKDVILDKALELLNNNN